MDNVYMHLCIYACVSEYVGLRMDEELIILSEVQFYVSHKSALSAQIICRNLHQVTQLL